jgi:quinol monooxygenase YgiN
VSASAFVLVDAILPVGNHTISEYLPRAEPGNISFEWSQSTDDPAAYFLVEVFRDAVAGEAHVASIHFKTAIAMLPELLAGPPEIIHADIAADGWSRMAELQRDPG